MKKEMSAASERNEEEVRKFKRKIEDLEFDKSSADRKAKALEDELSSKLEEISGLKSTVSQLTSASAGVESELKVTHNNILYSENIPLKKSQRRGCLGNGDIEAQLSGDTKYFLLKVTKKTLEKAQGDNARLNKENSERAARIDAYEEKERAYETERRKLHNTIQELKGNIRVFCRIRPLLGEERDAEGDTIR